MKKLLEINNLDFPISIHLQDNEKELFSVIYGKRIRTDLNYVDAARELGNCILNALSYEMIVYDGNIEIK